MKKFLLIICLLGAALRGLSQQFSQYNTGTLYDSFENPAEHAFVPDTSKTYAFNFLVPNMNANFFIRGDAQTSLMTRAFSGYYNNTALKIGSGQNNYVDANANAYFLMFKLFSSLKGNSELGFFLETKSEGHGVFTDESIALFNGPEAFPQNNYDNIFNNHYNYQIYDAVGFTYREDVTKRFSLGFKLSYLMGVDYNKLDIYESHISFDKFNDAATLSLQGRYYQSRGPGNFDKRSFLLSNRSPGAQISLGATYKNDDNVTFQANLKDLGFIHWYNFSTTSNFNASETITGLSTLKREDSIYNQYSRIVQSRRELGSFSGITDAKFELSATKSYWLDDDLKFKYSPTLIASKEMWYSGFTGALVNRFQYNNYYNFSLVTAYNNFNIFNLGAQLMYRNYNWEAYIGTEQLFQTVKFAGATKNGSPYSNGQSTGADFFLGFSIKFGPIVEHPMNASTIPTGEKGFIGRLWSRLFKTYR
ncbi:MAG: hypothetical protein JST32_03625 [Bacteroidetes bacterium]|nr:hypothetical protein [Bacteroidota bacterium]